MTFHNYAIVWIDQREARVFAFSGTRIDRRILLPHSPTSHIVRAASPIDGDRPLLNDDFFEQISHAVLEASAILVTGPNSAKTEMESHLCRHYPDAFSRVVGVETINHPGDGAFLAVARFYFPAIGSPIQQIAQPQLDL